MHEAKTWAPFIKETIQNTGKKDDKGESEEEEDDDDDDVDVNAIDEELNNEMED